MLDNPIPLPDGTPQNLIPPVKINAVSFPQENSFTNPLYISAVMVGLILIVTLIVYLGGIGSSNTETNTFGANTFGTEPPKENMTLELLLQLLFSCLLSILQYILSYYFSIDIQTTILNMFKPNQDPSIDININKTEGTPKPEPEPEPEPAQALEKKYLMFVITYIHMTMQRWYVTHMMQN